MRFFSRGKTYDFMRMRSIFIPVSAALIVLSALLVLGKVPGETPNFGTDFRGGTEIEVAFLQPVTTAEVRAAVKRAGFASPDVIKIEGGLRPNHYLIRVQEVTTLSEETKGKVERLLCLEGAPGAKACPEEHRSTEVKFSPGGDKITVRFREAPDLSWIAERMGGVREVRLRPGENNPFVQNARDHKVEIQLMSKGDQLMSGLKQALGKKAPDQALRAEWIGPRAGAQLRDSAIKSIAISLVFIMAYVAFRFDLRFAPGGVLALLHDSLGMVGIMVILGKEINLTTVAAALTIVGYSINDTVVIYDRVRENLGKLRGASFRQLINISVSEMLGRTILTSGTVLLSLLAFFIWGTGTLKDFALGLCIGVVLGTYSSIYIALPLTHWLDQLFFTRAQRSTKAESPG